mmetsp:Transcript_17771/g.19914  ORF Transcript_17771/g.19914 Transcript_17771/m.19914 type:complete len:128 (-) Transcript_17771:205-588(-)
MLFEALCTLAPSQDPDPVLWSSPQDHNHHKTTTTIDENDTTGTTGTTTTTNNIFLHSQNPGNRGSTYIWPEHWCLERWMNGTTLSSLLSTNIPIHTVVETQKIETTTNQSSRLLLRRRRPCHIYIKE